MTSSTIISTAAAIMAPSWRSQLALSLTLLGLAALCQGSSAPNYKCYSFDSTGKGAIKPEGDIILEVGSSYEAYCLFNPEEVQVENVYFESTGNDGGRIPHTVVNNSAIKVQVAHPEPTRYNLRCLVGDGNFLCQRTVFVGYNPKDVENFTCLSKNFLSLNCTWNVPENPVKVTYTLKYVVPGYLLESRDCPRAGKNWCYWEGFDFHSGQQEWVMIFTAKNKLIQEPVEFRHNVDLYASVIPDPASSFAVEVLGPQEVQLEWKLPYPIDTFTYGNVTHEVRYRMLPFRNMYEDSHWVLVDMWEESPPQFQRKLYTKVISNLLPHVEYEFSVRLHTGTGPVREEMWSKPALLVKRTEATRPAIAPLTTLGMFEVEETKLHRDVYVSWQTVDPLQENGPDFGYEVRMYDTRYESLLSSPLTTENGYAKFFKLENNVAYRFEIRPKNQEGLPESSDVKAEVIVPQKAALISTPSYFKVIAYPGSNTTTYMVRWRLPEHQQANHNIETVTLYWCKQTEYENRCQNKIEWEVIDEPDSYVKNLTGYDTSSRYMFGISVNSHNSSSGIKWSACIARHGVQQPAMQIFSSTYVSSTEVKLKWDLDCKAEAAQPNAFNISYCIVEENGKNCSEPEKYVRADGESTVEYMVRDLHPYRHYIFSIATISDLGLGKWTPSIRVKTKSSKPSGPPQNIRVIRISRTWISLAWEPPLESEQNGEIINYIIKNKTRDSQSFSQRQRNVLTFNFTNLEPFTDYHFEVVPCTKVNEGFACGSLAAAINAKTKIGVPGKIDSFQYDSPWLKWDHEECNGPSCSYELQYTVNGTTFWYTTPQRHTAVSLKDLNISCPVTQGEIPVSLRAVSTDEEGHRLLGPSREMKVTCPSKGSYNDDVPIIHSNTHIFLVPFSASNQYNTNLLSVLAILRAVCLQEHMRSAESIRLKSVTHGNNNNNNENYQKSLLNKNNVETVEDDTSSLRLMTERENERHHSLFGNEIDHQREPHHKSIEYSQQQLHMYWRWAPFMRQNIFWWFPIQISHQSNLSTRVPLRRENFLHSRHSNIPDASISNAEVMDDFQLQNNDHQKTEHGNIEPYSNDSADGDFPTSANQSESDSDEAVTTGNNPKVLQCPLLELIKSKSVEVSLNASNDNFELKISGRENFFKLLQSVNFPVHNYHVNERKLTSQNISHETGAHDCKTYESELNNDQQKHVNMDNHNVASSHESTDTNPHQNYALNTTLIRNFTNEEVMQEQALVNESSEFMGLSASNSHNNGSSVNESQKLPIVDDFTENPPHLPLLSDTYAFHGPHLEERNFSVSHNLSIDSDSESLHSVNVAEESSIPDSTESKNSINSYKNNISLYSEPAQSDVYTSTVTLVHNDSITVNASEPGNADMNRHRSRRNVQMTPVSFVQIPQRSQFSLLDFLQGKHRIGIIPQAPNELSLNEMETSHRGVIRQGMEFIENHREENALRNEDSTEGLKDMPHQYEVGQIKPIPELAHARASLIYNLGLMGSFNGNIERVSSQGERESTSLSQPEGIENVYPSFRHSDKRETRLKSDFSIERLDSTSGSTDHLKINNVKHNQMAHCPFWDILSAKDVALDFLKHEEDEYQLNIKGSGHSYDIIQTILAPKILH